MEPKIEALRAIAELAPNNVLVELTTAEVNDYASITGGSQWAQYLRRHKLIRTDAVLGDGKMVRRMAITPQGEAFLHSVNKYGAEAAMSYTRQKHSASRKGTKPTVSRMALLEQAKSALGPDATIAEILQAAQFLAGGES